MRAMRLGRRKRVLVDGFQLRYVVTSLIGLSVHVALAAAFVVGPLVFLVQRDVPRDEAPWSAIALLVLHEHFWPGLALLFLLEAARTIFMSHRVAGPLYRFRVVFARLADGDLAQRVRIRDGDYLWNEARVLDAAIAELRGRIDAVKSAAQAVKEVVASAEIVRDTDPHRVGASLARLDASLAALVTDPLPPAKPQAAPTAPPCSDASARDRRFRPPDSSERGMTLVEMLIVTGLLGTLLALALPHYWGAVEKARVTRAIGEIYSLDRTIQIFRNEHRRLPASLAEVVTPVPVDPWGRPYEYLRIDTSGTEPSPPGNGKGKGQGGGNVIGQARKDRNLVPINADFDLYSVGRDGKSASPLTAGISQDDVVRANSGAFVGLVRDY